MTTDTHRSDENVAANTTASPKASPFRVKLRGTIWSFGILYWMFVVTRQVFAFFADGYLSGSEIEQLFTVCLPFIAWICLKPATDPEAGLSVEDISTLKYYELESNIPQHEAYRHTIEARMLQLKKYHVISQEYFLPIPYLCQIYHLLNLKHLESVHSFSLNSLKVIDVSQLEPTTTGGVIKFQTVLDSPLNVLRIWRQPVVEVELILHTPYAIELSIPIYNGKKIIVMFNVLPLSNNTHKLFIDIYSNVVFPKPILQVFFHVASSLTVFEDLPYLQKLAEGNTHRSVKFGQSDRKTMWLFKRFVDLYGSSLEQPQPTGAVELQPMYAGVKELPA